jgi:hypothetical protein
LKAAIAGLLAGLVSYAPVATAAGDAPPFKILKLEGNAVQWWPASDGPRRVILYAAATRDLEFAGARNCRKLTGLDGLLAASEIAPDTLRREMAAAFAMWEAVADIAFREASTPAEADIVIGAQVEPEGWAFADVFYDVRSPEAVKPISRALVCLNPARRWKVGFDGDLATYDLRYTLAHEIGHAIGLDHPGGHGQIMGYRYEERFRELQPGDIAGVVQLYGARRPDDTVAASAPIEPLRARVRRVSPARIYAKRWGSRAFTPRPH